jgi:hypothetical protein
MKLPKSSHLSDPKNSAHVTNLESPATQLWQKQHYLILTGLGGLFLLLIIAVPILVIRSTALQNQFVALDGGTKTGNFQTVTDSAAAGGDYTKFTSAAPTPPPPPPAPTPTPPPPTPPPAGGSRCPAFPAFPTASCTGIPAGTSLAVVNGDVTLSAGATYTDKDVRGRIFINGNNITIRRVKAQNGVMIQGTNTLIEDVEMGASNGSGGDQGIGGSGSYTCRRCHIHNFSDGAKLFGTSLIEDSYINNLWYTSGDHNDGLQDAFGGGGTVTLRHNYISSHTYNGSGGENGAIQVADAWNGTLTMEYNLFDSGGNIVVRLHENGKYNVRNNRWTRKGGATHSLVHATILEWAGNAFQDNGQAIAR